jgi:hypothetical protein
MIRIAICIAVMTTGTANAEWNTRAGLPWLAAEKWHVPKRVVIPPPRREFGAIDPRRPRLDPYGR